jgi:hypothetical protein
VLNRGRLATVVIATPDSEITLHGVVVVGQ